MHARRRSQTTPAMRRALAAGPAATAPVLPKGAHNARIAFEDHRIEGSGEDRIVVLTRCTIDGEDGDGFGADGAEVRLDHRLSNGFDSRGCLNTRAFVLHAAIAPVPGRTDAFDLVRLHHSVRRVG